MNGILLVDKPAGWTSHDVVAKLRGVLGERRMGHSGTLDPMATGLLVVFAGRATRAVSFSENHTKCYEAHLRLGLTTDTQDTTGTVLSRAERTVSRAELEAVLPQFRGDILQVPPMYSALKVDGKKLYELAREGKTVERKARTVHFYEIDIKEINLPYVRFSVTCSKGTYIRTLCHDIGQKLGCGGCMEELLRSRVGRYSLFESHTLAQVEAAVADGTVQDMIDPVEAVLAEYPALYADSYGDRLLANGNPLSDNLVRPQHKEGWVRMYASDGTFTGIFQWDAGKKKYYPVKMF